MNRIEGALYSSPSLHVSFLFFYEVEINMTDFGVKFCKKLKDFDGLESTTFGQWNLSNTSFVHINLQSCTLKWFNKHKHVAAFKKIILLLLFPRE